MRWSLKKLPVTTMTCVTSLPHITSHYSERAGIIWKMKTSLYSPTHPSKLLYPTWWVLLCMSLFSYAFVLHPFLLFSKYPWESQCNRDPGPQRPLGKWKPTWITNSIGNKTVSEPDFGPNLFRVTHPFPPQWLWYHHPKILSSGGAQLRNVNFRKTKNLLLCKLL